MFHILMFFNYVASDSYLRVVGGRNARQGEFPYVVRLEREVKPNHFERFCTGSALTPIWTLTAGHCVTLMIPLMNCSNCFIRYNNFFPTNNGTVSKILTFKPHPNYNYRQKGTQSPKFDVALIGTDTINISQYGKLSALDYKTIIGHESFCVGYGNTNSTEEPAPLQVLKGMVGKCPSVALFGALDLCLDIPCRVKSTLSIGDSGGPTVHESGIVGVIVRGTVLYNKQLNELEYLISPSPGGVISPISIVLDWLLYSVKDNMSDLTRHRDNTWRGKKFKVIKS